MTYARHYTLSALSLLLLSSLQNTTAYMTPGEVFTELDVEESAPSEQQAATSEAETTPSQEPVVADDTSASPPSTVPEPTTAPMQNIEEQESAPNERRFYRKGEEYEQAKEPDVILPPAEPAPIVPAAPVETVPDVIEEQPHSAAPDETEETPEPAAMEPAATEQSGGILSQFLSSSLPWIIGAVVLGGGGTVFFLRKKKQLPTQIAAEQIAPPPPPQEQQASKRLEAAMEAMHAQDATPAAGSDAPAA